MNTYQLSEKADWDARLLLLVFIAHPEVYNNYTYGMNQNNWIDSIYGCSAFGIDIRKHYELVFEDASYFITVDDGCELPRADIR